MKNSGVFDRHSFRLYPAFVSFLLILCVSIQTIPAQQSSAVFPQCIADNCPIKDRENGITFGQTKLYDEKSFMVMLRGLEDGLSSLKLINQASLTGNYGRIQGGSLTTSSFGVNVTGMPVPGVVTTTNTGETITSNTVNNQSATPSVVSTLNTLSPNTTQQVTTNAAVTPAAASLPGQTSAFSAPAVGPMSQDLLAEQVSLQYQVMDLRLLLERSLTDRIFTFNDEANKPVAFGQKSSAIIGFNVTLDPQPQYRDAVAEVEIVVDSQSDAKAYRPNDAQSFKQNPGQHPGQAPAQNPGLSAAPAQTDELNAGKKPPSVVMMLPRDKTYNVTAATKDAKQIGLGAVLQVINIGVNAGKTNESLYIVGDLDTIAFERNRPQTSAASIVPPASSATFGWQFRPVLGQRTVKAGMRQLYALLALPDGAGSSRANPYVGKVKVFTRWRKYDRKNKIVKEVIEGSESYKELDDLYVEPSGASATLRPVINHLQWEDVGNGQILVNAWGQNYLDGISVLAGNKMIANPADGLSVQGDESFVLLLPNQTAAQIHNPWLMGRYGTPMQLALPTGPETGQPGWGIEIDSVRAKPISAQNSKVEIVLKARNYVADRTGRYAPPSLLRMDYDEQAGTIYKTADIRPIVVVGGKAFGFADAPLVKEAAGNAAEGKIKYSFVAPTQLLKDARKLSVKELFQQFGYADEKNIEWLDAFRPGQISVLFSNSATSSLAIGGGAFDRCRQIVVSAGTGEFVYEPDQALFAGAQPICRTAQPPVYGGTTAGVVNWKSASLITVDIAPQYFKGVKNLLVAQTGDEPVMLALAAPPEVPEPVVEKQDKVTVGMIKTIKLAGANFVSVSDVTFEGESLKPASNDAGTSLEITLNSRLTADAGEKQINFVLKNGKVKNYILIVEPRS